MSCVSNLLTNCCKFRVTSQLVLVNQSKDHKPVSKWLQRIWIFYQIFLVPRSWHQLVTCIVSTFLGCLIPVSKGSGNHRLLKRVLEHTSQLHAYIKVKIRPGTWDLRAFGKNFTSGEGLASKTWISLLHTAQTAKKARPTLDGENLIFPAVLNQPLWLAFKLIINWNCNTECGSVP
jgi:hypothetical protein